MKNKPMVLLRHINGKNNRLRLKIMIKKHEKFAMPHCACLIIAFRLSQKAKGFHELRKFPQQLHPTFLTNADSYPHAISRRQSLMRLIR